MHFVSGVFFSIDWLRFSASLQVVTFDTGGDTRAVVVFLTKSSLNHETYPLILRNRRKEEGPCGAFLLIGNMRCVSYQR